jgi:uncharacterized protein YndB with AHSA1/START domain
MARFEQQVTIDAPIDQVWAMMTNPQTWASWFPDVESITGLEAVDSQATFAWQDGTESGTGTITEVDTQRGLISVVTTKGDDSTTHTFDLDRTGGLFGIGANDTKLTYRREYKADGGFLGEFMAGGNVADALDVKNTLNKIKRLAQS